MDLFGGAVVFIIVWWLVLFMVLPFGVRPPDEPEPGMADGAPVRPRLGVKMLVTTAIAIAITLGIDWVLDSGLISLREVVTDGG